VGEAVLRNGGKDPRRFVVLRSLNPSVCGLMWGAWLAGATRIWGSWSVVSCFGTRRRDLLGPDDSFGFLMLFSATRPANNGIEKTFRHLRPRRPPGSRIVGGPDLHRRSRPGMGTNWAGAPREVPAAPMQKGHWDPPGDSPRCHAARRGSVAKQPLQEGDAAPHMCPRVVADGFVMDRQKCEKERWLGDTTAVRPVAA